MQHEAAVSERSSSLIAASSSVTAIYQESLQVRSFNKDAKDFSGPFMEVREMAERVAGIFLRCFPRKRRRLRLPLHL